MENTNLGMVCCIRKIPLGNCIHLKEKKNVHSHHQPKAPMGALLRTRIQIK